MAFQVMAFQPNGNPMPLERKTWNTREEAEKRKDELAKIYDTAVLFVSGTK